MNKRRSKKNRKTGFPMIILILGLVLMIAAAVVLTQNTGNKEISVDAIDRVTAAEARQATVNSQAILLDVRSEAAYQQMHAEGAVSIPLEELSNRLGELDPEKWVITYCT